MARPVVDLVFPNFTASLEGRLKLMYLDDLGIVTTAQGNNITPVDLALQLPWKHGENGPRATQSEIIEGWNIVNSHRELAGIGGGNVAFEALTDLRLSDADVDDLMRKKFRENDDALRAIFPNWDQWPSEGQLGAHSMTWAMGAGKWAMFPKFRAAVARLDFDTAAAECHMQGTGIEKRNAIDKTLFEMAANVVQQGLARDAFSAPIPMPGGGSSPQPSRPPPSSLASSSSGGDGGSGGFFLLLTLAALVVAVKKGRA